MPTAVLLHGTGESPASWDAVAAALGPDWTCRRPKPEEVGKTFVAPPFVLVGHSYGGWEALRYAARHPERVSRLVLIEPIAFAVLEGWDDDALARIRASAEPFNLRALIEFWYGPDAWSAMPLRAQFRLMAEEPRTRRQKARFDRLPASLDVLRTLPVATAVAYGTATVPEAIRVCERLVELLPDAELTTIDGAGHASPRTHPVEVAQLIG